ncbi:MAG TPA: Cof-type HAD-IIB family hydrolase [Cerasibacillus sp.]|uniref:Cof-type HAD-IIB family hydrolase n=1 Tax=Cerasibacillus sp. TaxID=2498711 RepID=UPI002F3EBE18
MKNGKHLIALDLDGTLLTGEKTISSYTKEIIFTAKERGHIVVIATGRPHRSSIHYYNELYLNTPMVNFNGALVHHPKNKAWESSHNPLDHRTALRIVDACYDFARNMMAEVQDNVFLDQHDQKFIDTFLQHTDQLPFTVGRLHKQLREDPTSLLIYPHEEYIDELREHLDEVHADWIEHRKWGSPWHMIEIVKKGMNKAVGLDKIAQYYHIPKERIIAFGDEDNDLEMIEYAGVGVAMDNGIDELKSVANYVTDTNDADGIGKFIEDYLNIGVKP